MQPTKREWRRKNIDAKKKFNIGFVFQIIYWSKHKEKNPTGRLTIFSSKDSIFGQSHH